MKSKTRILIVDDHALIRRGLADLLRYEKDLAVVGEASDGEAAVAVATELKPDVVVMDLMMPVMDGVEATRRIKAVLPEAKILILTTFGTSVDVARAIAAGASGAIMKDASREDQLNAIRTVASGDKVLSPEIEKAVQEEPLPEVTERRHLRKTRCRKPRRGGECRAPKTSAQILTHLIPHALPTDGTRTENGLNNGRKTGRYGLAPDGR